MKIKNLFLGLLFAGALCAQQQVANHAGDPHATVYVTAKGHTYHTSRDCIGLKRGQVLVSDEHAAETHGLTLCSICAHRKHAQAKNTDWAKPEAK